MQNGNSEAFNDWMREVRWPLDFGQGDKLVSI